MSQTPGGIVAEHGTVKWFDPRKGFGFIVGPEGQDVFVHYSVIMGDGFRALKDGSEVEYDAAQSDKGWRATRVVPDQATAVVVTRQQERRHAAEPGPTEH